MFRPDPDFECECENDESDWSESVRNAFNRALDGGVPAKVPKLGLSIILNKQIVGIFPNFIPKDTDLSLYRIDSFEHLQAMLSQEQMVLVRPESWEDPWEDPIFKSSEVFAPDMKNRSSFSCFAQCWSCNPACAALWHDRHGKGRTVRIETTVSRMLDGILCPDLRCFEACEQFFLKPISYLSDEDSTTMRSEIEEQWKNDQIPPYDFEDCRLAMLFSKRQAFEYEKEVRLVWRVPNKSDADFNICECVSPSTPIIAVPIIPKTLVKSVQVDPWCDDAEYQTLKDVIGRFGISCAKSDLVAPMWKQKHNS